MRVLLLGVLLCRSLFGDQPPAAYPLPCRFPYISVGARFSSSGSKYVESKYLLRKTKVAEKTVHEVLEVTETDIDENFKTVTLRRNVVQGQPEVVNYVQGTTDLRHLKEDPAAAYKHMGFVRQIMAKNLGTYRRRRPHWTADFRKNLATAAAEYLNDSVYTAVVDKRTNRVVGGVRFILAPYGVNVKGQIVADGWSVNRYYGPVSGFREEGEVLGSEQLPRPPRRLPEEVELNIDLDGATVEGHGNMARDGLKMEMGALFVDETLSPEDHKKVWGELWLHTLKMSQDSGSAELNHYGTTIHAYADKFSLKLYLPLGFELNRSYYKDGKLMEYGPDEVVPPIKKADGSEWWPIVYHPEQINGFVTQWMAGKFKNRGGEEVRQRLHEMGELENRGSRPISVALEQVETLVSSFARDPASAAIPASEVIMNLAQTQADHYRARRNSTPRTDIYRRANLALDQLEPSFKELAKHLPSVVKAPEVWRREQLAMTARVLLETGETRSVLTNAEVVDKILGPLLIDPDLGVRETALYELRNAFPVRQGVYTLSAPAWDFPMTSKLARDELEARGLTENQIDRHVSRLGQHMDAAIVRATAVDPANRYDEMEVRQYSQALGELVGKDPKIIRCLLYLTLNRK